MECTKHAQSLGNRTTTFALKSRDSKRAFVSKKTQTEPLVTNATLTFAKWVFTSSETCRKHSVLGLQKETHWNASSVRQSYHHKENCMLKQTIAEASLARPEQVFAGEKREERGVQ